MSYLVKSFLLFISGAVMVLGQPAMAVVSQGESLSKSDSLPLIRSARGLGDCCIVHSRPYGTVLDSLVAQEIRAMKRVFMPSQVQPVGGSPVLRPSAEVIQPQPVILDLP